MKILVDELPKREFECPFCDCSFMRNFCKLGRIECYVSYDVLCPYLVELKEDDICELGCEGEGKANS